MQSKNSYFDSQKNKNKNLFNVNKWITIAIYYLWASTAECKILAI